MNLSTVATLQQHEQGLTSILLFWQYVVAAPIQSFYVGLFNWVYSTPGPVTTT